MLHAELEPTVPAVDLEDLDRDALPRLQDFIGVIETAIGGDVGNMQQAFNAFRDLDKRSEVGSLLHRSRYDRADRMIRLKAFPGIAQGLLQAQCGTALAGVQFEDDGLDFFANGEYVAGMMNPARPGHFGDVNQAFGAGEQFDESAEVLKPRDGAAHAIAHGELRLDGGPGVRL